MLLGRSGSGKTTCLKMINRLLHADRGEVRVDGISVTQWDASSCAGGSAMPSRMSACSRITQCAKTWRWFPSWSNGSREKSPRVWKKCWRWWDCRRRSSRTVIRISFPAGSGSASDLARALAAEPPILLMDEPFGALDPITRAELQMEFKKLQQKLAKTIVFVTHDVGEALLLGSRIGLMEEGRLRGVYSGEEFLALAGRVGEGVCGCIPGGATDVSTVKGFPSLNFLFTHKREVATLTAEHLWLVGISMLLAIAIGVPLGILLTRRPRWKALVLGKHEHRPNHSQPGAIRAAAAAAVAGRARRSIGDRRSGALRAASHRSQHLRWHCGHQRAGPGSGGCDGPYVRPTSVACRTAAGAAGDACPEFAWPR